MKQCVQFPDENILIVRPCLVAICAGNRPAAKLLGSLLFRGNLRIENKDDAKNLNTIKSSKGQTADQDTSTRIYRKQSQLVEDMCGEITEKTIHDVAVPWLQFLGYLDIQEFPGSNCYDVHFEAVQAALDVYVNNPRQLETFLIDHLQLEKFLIDLKIEKFPIDKKSFLLVLEIILIANRNISNDKRGRKPASEGSLGGISRRLKNLKEITKNNTEEDESNSESTDTHTFVSSDTARAEYPLITFADCLTYLQEQRVAPQGEDAVEIMVQARTLYAHKHPLQDEELPIDDAPQGDEHAATSGHSHRVDDATAPGNDTSYTAMAAGHVATPEARPVLEAGQEITEGEHHASRVPTVPAANPAASLKRHVSRPGSDHSRDITHPDNGFPVVHAVGSATASGVGSREADVQRPVGKDGTAQVAETPTTPMPAQSLSLPQAEQAALGARQSTKAEKKTGKAEPVKPEFTPEGEALYRDWCSLFHVTIPKTKAIILAANELAEPITIWAEQKLDISKAEVLKRIMNWLYKNNANYYGEGRGVKLYDIHRDFEEWQSAAERKLAKDALKVVVSPAEDKSRIFSMEPIILPSRTHKGGLRGKVVATTH